MNKLTKENKEQLIFLYQNGISPKELGEKFGIYNNSVNRIIRKAELSCNQAAPRVSEETKEFIIKEYISGKNSEKLSKELNISPTTVCRILKNNNIKIRPGTDNKRKYPINENWLDTIDSGEKAYFLGLFYADGSLSKNKNDISIRLKTEDELILIKLSKMWYSTNRVRHEGNMSNLSIYSKKNKNRMIELGVTNNKSKTIKFPDFISDNLLSHFIRGYLDGDGGIHSKKRWRVSFTGNEYIILEINKILMNQNINTSYYYNKKKDSHSVMVCSYDSIKKTLDWLYADSTIHMTRKYEQYLDFLKVYKYKFPCTKMLK